MTDRELFFLDADGWLVGPESAPFPNEAHAVNAALDALRDGAAGLELEVCSRLSARDRPRGPASSVLPPEGIG
jgi:hypothetical protein